MKLLVSTSESSMESEMEAESRKIMSRNDVRQYLENNDNSSKLVLGSGSHFSEECIVGVDEAGRGPVLGPMVYGICYYPLKEESIFKELGCADSKSLTDKKREGIFEEMCSKDIGWIVEAISPNFICNNMLKRSKCSLNQIAQDSTVDLLTKLINLKVKIARVYIDTVGMPDKYQEKLTSIFPNLKITVAKKADATYPVVSAASICAKVIRDTALQAWVFREDSSIPLENLGSGYPNDPVTKKFLAENLDPIFGFPQIVRFSWSTAEKILENGAESVEWEDVEDKPISAPSISSFFKKTIKEKHTRHNFFKERNICSTVYM